MRKRVRHLDGLGNSTPWYSEYGAGPSVPVRPYQPLQPVVMMDVPKPQVWPKVSATAQIQQLVPTITINTQPPVTSALDRAMTEQVSIKAREPASQPFWMDPITFNPPQIVGRNQTYIDNLIRLQREGMTLAQAQRAGIPDSWEARVAASKASSQRELEAVRAKVAREQEAFQREVMRRQAERERVVVRVAPFSISAAERKAASEAASFAARRITVASPLAVAGGPFFQLGEQVGGIASWVAEKARDPQVVAAVKEIASNRIAMAAREKMVTDADVNAAKAGWGKFTTSSASRLLSSFLSKQGVQTNAVGDVAKWVRNTFGGEIASAYIAATDSRVMSDDNDDDAEKADRIQRLANALNKAVAGGAQKVVTEKLGGEMGRQVAQKLHAPADVRIQAPEIAAPPARRFDEVGESRVDDPRLDAILKQQRELNNQRLKDDKRAREAAEKQAKELAKRQREEADRMRKAADKARKEEDKRRRESEKATAKARADAGSPMAVTFEQPVQKFQMPTADLRTSVLDGKHMAWREGDKIMVNALLVPQPKLLEPWIIAYDVNTGQQVKIPEQYYRPKCHGMWCKP